MKGLTWVFTGMLMLGLATMGFAALEEETSTTSKESFKSEEVSSDGGTMKKETSTSLKEEKVKKPLEVVGKIESVNDKDSLLKVQELEEPGEEGAGKSMEFAINDDTSIMKGDREISLQDLEIGSQVTVTYKKPFLGFLGKKTALSIECE